MKYINLIYFKSAELEYKRLSIASPSSSRRTTKVGGCVNWRWRSSSSNPTRWTSRWCATRRAAANASSSSDCSRMWSSGATSRSNSRGAWRSSRSSRRSCRLWSRTKLCGQRAPEVTRKNSNAVRSVCKSWSLLYGSWGRSRQSWRRGSHKVGRRSWGAGTYALLSLSARCLISLRGWSWARVVMFLNSNAVVNSKWEWLQWYRRRNSSLDLSRVRWMWRIVTLCSNWRWRESKT